MFEHRQAEAEIAISVVCRSGQSFLLPVNEFFAQLLEAFSLEIVLAGVMSVERRSADIGGVALSNPWSLQPRSGA
jgi:hypothetical protein